MSILKRGLIFLGVYLVISIVAFSLTALWESHSKPTMEVFRESPFVFAVEGNTTYTVLLGTLNGDQPSPRFDAVDVAASWTTNTEDKPKLELERDSGRTQIASYDRRYGDVKAISFATLRPRASGTVQVSVAGWNGTNYVYAVDHGFGRFFIEIFGVAALNVMLTAAALWFINRRRLAKASLSFCG